LGIILQKLPVLFVVTFGLFTYFTKPLVCHGETFMLMHEESQPVVVQAEATSASFAKGRQPGLVHLMGPGGRTWADAAYQWTLELGVGDEPHPTELIKAVTLRQPRIDTQMQADGSHRVHIAGIMAGCSVEVNYHIAADGSWIEERISITNQHDQPVRIENWNFGLTKQLTGGTWGAALPGVSAWRAAAVPWRRPLHDPDTIADYDIATLLTLRGGQNPLLHDYPVIPWTDGLPSEAWALLHDDQGVLVLKFNDEQIEYSVLRHESRALAPQAPQGYEQISRMERGPHLIFGGSTRSREDPTPDKLAPGQTISLGLTRYEFFEGDWRTAFDRFKINMNRRGKGLPTDYDPPMHWNQLYSSAHQWWLIGPALEQSKQQHYRVEDLHAAATTAVAYNCETLYLDPGWDTSFGSLIWDEARLGAFPDFLAMIQRDFGLKVGMHAPGAAWCDPQSYPQEAKRMARDGSRPGVLCGGSHAYLQARAERLQKLARQGASFFLLDGSFYTGPCYDPDHGHAIPYTRDTHRANDAWLARQIHQANPNTTVQLHDMQTNDPYVPVYLGYGSDGWDEMWAWEMWHSVLDYLGVRSYKAKGLYYYNLAYDIPLYLHVDLRGDNEHALGFWWYASTVCHLGIGGATDNAQLVKALQDATARYQSLKPFFVQGKFYGLDEHIHVHTLPHRNAAVINCFNFDQDAMRQTVRFRIDQVGLDPKALYHVEGAAQWHQDDGKIAFDVELPGHGTAVIEIKPQR